MATRKLMTILAAAVLLLSAYFFYTQRLQIEARIWHLRYGNWLHISDYDVPVPGEWLVRHGTDEDPIVLIDTQQRRDRRMLDINSIVISFQRSPVGVETWQSITEDGLRVRGKLTVEEKRLQTDAQTAVCLTGHEFRDVMHIAGMNMVTADCMSSTGLHLTLIGDNAGLEKLYGIISGIRKRG
jgi:hypothetical protein